MTAMFRTSLHLAPSKRDMYRAGVSGWPRMNVPDAPRCVNPDRRRAAKLGGPRAFKKIYFPKYKDTGSFHGAFLDECHRLLKAQAVLYHAEADPRGIGKTTDKIIADIWAGFYRLRTFALWVTVNGPKACERIGSFKEHIYKNELLYEDFPEIIQPIRDFGGDSRAAQPYVWSANEILLPGGMWICGYGIDGSLLGMIKNNKRPDNVTIDDPEDEATIHSAAETEMRRKRIEKEISALHGQGEFCTYTMLCTVRAVGCIADEYTDQEKRPDWSGTRRAAQLAPPLHVEMWEHYKMLCRTPPRQETEEDRKHFIEKGVEIAIAIGMSADEFASLDFGYRKGLEYYAANKAAMDEGCVMLEPVQLPVHKFYWFWALKGEDFVASELQNDPKANPNIQDLRLIEHQLLSRRIETLPAGIVPAWAAYATVTIDLGLYRLHCQADAWSADGTTSHLLECCVEDTQVDAGGQWKAMIDPNGKQLMSDEAIRNALERLRIRFSLGFEQAGSAERMLPVMYGVDCGGVAGQSVKHAWDKVVFLFCSTAPGWIPLKGESPWLEAVSDRAEGRWFICEEKNNPGQRIDCHVDGYKKRAYDAYQLPTIDQAGSPVRGTRTLHMDSAHKSLLPYCLHQASEKHVERFLPGRPTNKDMRVGWEKISSKGIHSNHWWDTCWMAYALSDIYQWKIGSYRPRRMASSSGNGRGGFILS